MGPTIPWQGDFYQLLVAPFLQKDNFNVTSVIMHWKCYECEEVQKIELSSRHNHSLPGRLHRVEMYITQDWYNSYSYNLFLQPSTDEPLIYQIRCCVIFWSEVKPF